MNYVIGLTYVAIQPPLIITAIGFPPSTSAVEMFYSETTGIGLARSRSSLDYHHRLVRSKGSGSGRGFSFRVG